jgi:hypothetical protein
MHATGTQPSSRTTLFAPRLRALLDEHRGEDLFRLEPDTVALAGPELMDRVLAARPATESERPTFRPLHGRSISRGDASTMMQAIGKDVRAALKKPVPKSVDLSGEWPQTGHVYLRDIVLGGDPRRLRMLMNRTLELTPKLTWTVIAAGAALPLKLSGQRSAIADVTAGASSYHDRRWGMGMYRRTAAPVCFTISTLVANALWLGSPFDDSVSNRNILHEALRLIPPSWNILRNASPEYAEIDSRIKPTDDVLILPLLSHRDPALWDAPDEFRPERWDSLDPETHPGYLPFGHVSERCWGRHMVMPLAEMLLDVLRETGCEISPTQATARIPLAGLLGVADVRVVRRGRDNGNDA